MNKELFNASKFKGGSTGFLKKDCLDENILASDKLLQLVKKF